MRRATPALVACGLLAAGGIAAAAGAAPAPRPVVARDAKADVTGPLDLTRVSVARGPDGRIRASLTVAAAWEPALLRAPSGPPGSICLKAWTVSVPPDTVPDYLICATADRTGALRGSVLRERPNRLPARVAAAEVSRPTARTVTLRFAQSAIGAPARLRAAGESTAPGCAKPACIDTAPDAPATLALTLRATR